MKQIRRIIREVLSSEDTNDIIVLVFRKDYARNYVVARVEVDEYTANRTQQYGAVESRYKGSISDIASLIAEDYPGERIRIDYANPKKNEAIILHKELKNNGVNSLNY